MEFEAEMLREDGVEFKNFPLFQESLIRMMKVAAVRQAINAVDDGNRYVDPDATLDLLIAMVNPPMRDELLRNMKNVAENYAAINVMKPVSVFFSGLSLLFIKDSRENAVFVVFFMCVTLLWTMRLFVKYNADLDFLLEVEKGMIRFYDDLEKVVKSHGQEGWLASSVLMKEILEEMEQGLHSASKGEAGVYGDDFVCVPGHKIFKAMKDKDAMSRLLKRKTTVGETDSTLQSLQSDSDSP